MAFDPQWYTQHPQEVKESDPTVFEEMPLNKFAEMVNKSALSNSDLHAEALRKADSYSFQIAHPEFLQTAKNIRLMNNWLTSNGITHPSYPNFQAAYDFLNAEGLLEIDEAELAKLQDQRGNRTFKGAISGTTYDSLDSMIAQERVAALHKLPAPTEEEIAFENLPIEQVQTLLRQGERRTMVQENSLKTRKNGDAWITLHPEYVDSKHNGDLMAMQLKANDVKDGNASIEDYEKAYRQLRASELLTMNKTALTKQHAAEVAQLASQAVKTPGSVFDTTTEAEMETLPLDEIRRRANGNFSGVGL